MLPAKHKHNLSVHLMLCFLSGVLLMFCHCSYFHTVLNGIISHNFYSSFVCLPGSSSTLSDRISRNPKFVEFFADCIGAIDGSHIYAHVPPNQHVRFQDCHANISQNILAVCGFDELFTYILSGWEGSASDATVYTVAHCQSLAIPPTKYVLGDAGFPSCLAVLVPYCGAWYHLKEWGRANEWYVLGVVNIERGLIVTLLRPSTPEELFNLRHAQLCNVIEWIFSILKQTFCVLLLVSPKFDKTTQAKLIPALVALHNFC